MAGRQRNRDASRDRVCGPRGVEVRIQIRVLVITKQKIKPNARTARNSRQRGNDYQNALQTCASDQLAEAWSADSGLAEGGFGSYVQGFRVLCDQRQESVSLPEFAVAMRRKRIAQCASMIHVQRAGFSLQRPSQMSHSELPLDVIDRQDRRGRRYGARVKLDINRVADVYSNHAYTFRKAGLEGCGCCSN